ncbi:hypothetical protein ACJX0J_021625, partial [Zea mays]
MRVWKFIFLFSFFFSIYNGGIGVETQISWRLEKLGYYLNQCLLLILMKKINRGPTTGLSITGGLDLMAKKSRSNKSNISQIQVNATLIANFCHIFFLLLPKSKWHGLWIGNLCEGYNIRT